MRLLHVIHAIDLAQGGVVRSVLDLTSGLAARGHEVRVLTQRNVDGPGTGDAPELPGVEIVEAPGPPRSFRRLSPAGLELAARESEWADVVHFHALWHPMHLDVARLAREANRGCVLSTHGMLDDYTMKMKPLKKRVYLRLAGTRVLESMHFMHCTSPIELSESRRWFGAARDRGRVIPLALDVDALTATGARAPSGATGGAEVREKLGLPPGKIVLFLGRVHPIKGLPLLVEAFARMRERDDAAVLVIAGDEESKAEANLIRSLVRERGLDERVRLVGVVNGAVKTALLSEAEVLVLPSHHENFGMVIPEALMCGTPVVVTKGVGIWPDVVDRGAGLAVERDPDGLSKAIRSVLDDPAAAAAMAQAGADWVRQCLSGDAVMSQYESMYEDAVQRAKTK